MKKLKHIILKKQKKEKTMTKKEKIYIEKDVILNTKNNLEIFNINKLKININVVVEKAVNKEIMSNNIEDKYDDQTLEDWYNFASNIESIIDKNFIVKKISISKNKTSLSEYINFYRKDKNEQPKEVLLNLRLLDHKSTTNSRRVRKNKVKKN